MIKNSSAKTIFTFKNTYICFLPFAQQRLSHVKPWYTCSGKWIKTLSRAWDLAMADKSQKSPCAIEFGPSSYWPYSCKQVSRTAHLFADKSEVLGSLHPIWLVNNWQDQTLFVETFNSAIQQAPVVQRVDSTIHWVTQKVFMVLIHLIALSSLWTTGSRWILIHWTSTIKTYCVIQRIEIYPMDSAIPEFEL